MPQWVNSDAVKAARKANLYDYLMRHHYGDVKKEGNSLRLRDNNSVSVKAGYSGYTDFATGEKGNSVDFLTTYLGYEFQNAVAALCSDIGLDATGPPEHRDAQDTATRTPQAAKKDQDAAKRIFVPPEPLQGQYRQLYAYLTQQRGIPPALIQRLIDDRLLYQAADHGNMVFIDPAKTFMEIRGSNSVLVVQAVRPVYEPGHRLRLRGRDRRRVPVPAAVPGPVPPCGPGLILFAGRRCQPAAHRRHNSGHDRCRV